jgi:hypothetical protein
MFFGTISMVQWFWIDGLQKQRQKQMQQQKQMRGFFASLRMTS